MPIFEFQCGDCKKKYEALCSFDEKGKYQKVKCEFCGSKKKKKLMTTDFSFTFNNPEGTDKWNNSHDYRFHHKMPKAAAERENAQKAAKEPKGLTGPSPYREFDDLNKNNFGEVK